MKYSVSLLALTTLLALAPLGCSQSDSTGGAAASDTTPSFDLSKIEGAFSSATGTVKAEFDKVIAAIKGADYSGAWEQVQTLAGNAGLSDDQKSALSELMAQIKAKGGDMLKGAADTAGKAVEQVKDAAGKAAGQATDAAKKATDNLLPK